MASWFEWMDMDGWMAFSGHGDGRSVTLNRDRDAAKRMNGWWGWKERRLGGIYSCICFWL